MSTTYYKDRAEPGCTECDGLGLQATTPQREWREVPRLCTEEVTVVDVIDTYSWWPCPCTGSTGPQWKAKSETRLREFNGDEPRHVPLTAPLFAKVRETS